MTNTELHVQLANDYLNVIEGIQLVPDTRESIAKIEYQLAMIQPIEAELRKNLKKVKCNYFALTKQE